MERKTQGLDFGEALKELRNGELVQREGWNGTGMFIFLVPGSHFSVNRRPLLGIFPEGTPIDYRPHLDMKCADGTVVTWVASQTDLLASDWRVLDEAARVAAGIPGEHAAAKEVA